MIDGRRRHWVSKEGLAVILVIGLALVLASFHLRLSHAWGDDFAGYLLQARSLVEGRPGAEVALNGELQALADWRVGPDAYPWGFPALLAAAYLRTRSLWMPWGVHFAWNLTLGLGFGLPVSGLSDFAVAVQGTAQGPEWLTGGSYGIEASLTGTVIILVGLLVLVRLTPPRPAPAFANRAQEANHSLSTSAEGSG